MFETALLNDVDPADYIYNVAIFAIEVGEALLPWELAAFPTKPELRRATDVALSTDSGRASNER